MWKHLFRLLFTCLKFTMETPEQCTKPVYSIYMTFSSMKPILTQWGGLSNYKVSPTASTRRACRSDATVFEPNKQNKQIFLSTLPRTWILCWSFLVRLWPLSRVLTLEANQMQCPIMVAEALMFWKQDSH